MTLCESMDRNTLLCPTCKSRWIWKMGVDIEQSGTLFIRMLCEDCGERFALEILEANSSLSMMGVQLSLFNWSPSQAKSTDRKLPSESKQHGIL